MVLNHGERRGGRDVYLPPRQGALRPSVPPPWIDKNSPIPMYYQIMSQLREQISAGEYTVDDALPPERELVETYQVSRMTIRQAISELVNAGSRIISFKGMVRVPAIRKTLGLSTEDAVFECVRLRLADEEPMALETTSLVASICPGLRQEDLENQSLYKVVTERWGIQLDHATQSLEPILAPPYEAMLLHVAPGSPLLLMHRVTYEQNGRAFEHVKSLYRGDRYKFVTELHRRAER